MWAVSNKISSQEDECVHLAVKHYYIQFGSVFNRENAQKVVDECITTTLIESKSMTTWIQLISTGHSQVKIQKSIGSIRSLKLSYFVVFFHFKSTESVCQWNAQHRKSKRGTGGQRTAGMAGPLLPVLWSYNDGRFVNMQWKLLAYKDKQLLMYINL